MRSSQTGGGAVAQYRQATPVARKLLDNCKNYFEEELYTSGLTLLLHVLTSGSSRCSEPRPPAFTPPPNFLALAGSLIVEPRLTTKTRNPADIVASNTAYKLLRLVSSIVGPVNADFSSAFVFSGATGHRRSNTSRGRKASAASSEHGDDDRPISEMQLRLEPLWDVAQDFWHLIGWSFCCAANHPARWERYRILIDILIDAMIKEWELKSGQHNPASQSQSSQKEDVEAIKSTMIYKYIESGTSAFGGSIRRILRAITASGTEENITQFPEIYPNEGKIKRPSDPTKPKPIRKSTSKSQFGDWEDSSSDEGDDSSNAMKLDPAKIDPSSSANPEADTKIDDESFFELQTPAQDPYQTHRYRVSLLSLLWQTTASPVLSALVEPQTLINEMASHFRSLPPSHLLLFTNTSPYLPLYMLEHLLREALPDYLRLSSSDQTASKKHSSSSSRSRQAQNLDLLSAPVLVSRVLPAATHRSSYSEAARASLWIELAVRLVDEDASAAGVHTGSPPSKVKDAVEEGFKARRARAAEGRRKPSGSKKKGRDEDEEDDIPSWWAGETEEEMAKTELERSEGRIRRIVEKWVE